MKRLAIIAVSAVWLITAVACTTAPGSSTPSVSTPSSSASSGSIPASSGTDTTNGIRTGLGFVATTSESNSAATDAAGTAKFSVAVCGVTLDGSGKILDISFDTVQAKVEFDASGALKGDVTGAVKTKKELGDSYGMKKASGIGKEWYEQIAALEDWMRGKTVDEVLEMKVADKGTPEDENLKTSVTISVADQLHALEKAYSNAK